MLSRVAFLLVTLIVSTHQLGVAEEMADRIGIIHEGGRGAVGGRAELGRQSGATGPLEKTFLALPAQEGNLLEGKTQPIPARVRH
jgi:ABC-type multidrug transport system ATPase subunit